MDADGRNVALLTAPWPYDVVSSRESLSPDGARVVYTEIWRDQPAVLIRPVEDRQGQPIAVFEEGEVSSPVWSPVRNQVAFVASVGGGAQIWVVNVNGGGLRQVTPEGEKDAGHPSFSPDGNWLVYWSADAFGPRQVWIIALDGTGRKNISSNVYDEWDPLWAK
jgi:TolB protein